MSILKKGEKICDIRSLYIFISFTVITFTHKILLNRSHPIGLCKSMNKKKASTILFIIFIIFARK